MRYDNSNSSALSMYAMIIPENPTIDDLSSGSDQ